MFDSLARLADGHARRIGLIAIGFFVLAGALGGSVASKLEPYGADDPATESVKARDNLEDAGFRDARVIVLLRTTRRAGHRPRAGSRRSSTRSANDPTSRR